MDRTLVVVFSIHRASDLEGTEMPLGYSGYWDFDLSGYEDALMELAGAQRRANRMTWPEFLSGLGQTVSQNMLLKKFIVT